MIKQTEIRTGSITLYALFLFLFSTSQFVLAQPSRPDLPYLVVSLSAHNGACVSKSSVQRSPCEPVSSGDYLDKHSVVTVSQGKIKLFLMSSKSMIMLSEGSHRLDYLETKKPIQVSDKERIAKLFRTGYRSTASVATRSKNKAACFKQINLDKEFWAINCKLQATTNKKPKNTLATVLPKASNYRSIPKQVLVGEFASSHYIASENFCKTIDEHAIELAEKELTSGKAILILSPKGYDWEENTILPISSSCKQSLDQELAELNTLDLDKSLREQLIYHAYKTHGLIFDASETLRQHGVN